ncbi:MAG: hypothetical protein IBX57_00095 [Gammaproteobacteria bacterium]|nr:hypothetical protein [Gammaproteobacteria bacterium]
MRIILPSKEYTDILKIKSDNYCNHNNLPEIPMEVCFLMVEAMFDTAHFSRLLWCKSYARIEDAVAHIPWWTYEDVEITEMSGMARISQDYYVNIIDELFLGVMELTQKIVPITHENDQWVFWLKSRNSYDILIEKAEDYRIMVYNEKMRNGEW